MRVCMQEIAVTSLKERVIAVARELGFKLVGVTSAEPFDDYREIAQHRVRDGYMGEMRWYTEERVQRASDPRTLLPGARSVVVVGLSYLPPDEEDDRGAGADSRRETSRGQASTSFETMTKGRVARYARWVDYHQVMKAKLRELVAAIHRITGADAGTRIFVDDSALLERGVAERAGVGWFGKNTNILTQSHGSWVFLGALITDLPLQPDQPLKKSCGECTRCIPACPTGAIIAPYALDARRCISYLTIEHRGPIPEHLRSLVGDWVFGCDICQEVCPVNREVEGASMPELRRTGFDAVELFPLLSMDREEFARRFRNTPIKRAKLEGMKRNACVVLGNLKDERAVPALGSALRDGQPLVRGHAAWALGRIATPEARRALEAARAWEEDLYVAGEVTAALTAVTGVTPAPR